jgi:FAD/FMN-containing dehydrogenase
MPVGVFVPRSDRRGAALDICRELSVPIVPRGGGTSQCGQTVGAALVIDCSKHLRKVLARRRAQRTVEVEPGMVLDHLNAQLKPHGLWYPVDVSTSAQATLGGMAGNNSCGSRSIAYGNMVHNVLGAKAWTADGSPAPTSEPDAQATGRSREIGQSTCATWPGLRPEIDARWPKVLRRVAATTWTSSTTRTSGPTPTTASVNLAHLLVGSEGTLASRNPDAALSELPRAKVLGVVNFPTFYKAMDRPSTS